MSNQSEPLSKFQQGGRASIINYNIPDTTSYGGQGYIDLGINSDWFADEAKQGTTFPNWVGDRYGIGVDEVDHPDDQHGDYRRIHDAIRDNEAFERVREDLGSQLEGGILNEAGGPLVLSRNAPAERALEDAMAEFGATETARERLSTTMPLALRSIGESEPTEESDPISSIFEHMTEDDELLFDPAILNEIHPQKLATDVLNNNIPLVYSGFSGVPSYVPVPAPREINPRLMLVERYRISTYLGDYGAGRTLKTFSLLPGEQTTISIKTFKQKKETRKRAESILESKSRSAAQSFERQIEREQWNKEEYQQSKSWTKKSNWEAGGEASVGVNLGIVSFDAGGGGGGGGSTETSGSSKVARSSFAKNTMNAVSETSSEASSHREVEINTDQEVSEETRYEKTTERILENINLSRTLNFVFRQLNQEFVTIFHLEDVRVAFTNDAVSPDSSGRNIDGLEYNEVPLWKLDELLADYIVEDRRDDVRQQIRRELENVIGYDGETYSIVSEGEIEDIDGSVVDTYLHVEKGDPHEYRDPRVDPDVEPDQQPIRVPGVILDVGRNRMRTEGVIVEALLGKGEALDAYSDGLQSADVTERQLENDRRRAAVERQELAREIIRNGDDSTVERYEQIFDTDEEDVSINVTVGESHRDGEGEGEGSPERP